MKIDLSGKKAIVTGASLGIGLGIAKGLLKAGADVVICGRNAETLENSIKSLKTEGLEKVTGHALDLATAEGCSKLIQLESECDILINNLGIYGGVDFFDIDDEKWDEMLQTNVMSGIRLSRHYAKGMRDKGWGRIQFISSESAVNIPADMVHYGVSKAAMQGVSRGLAKVLAGSGVTVNAILPGPTLTEGVTDYIGGMAKEKGVSLEEMQQIFLQENRPSTCLWRFATPEEVANMCVYIASEQASYTSGASLKVEGGIVETTI